MKKKHLVAPAAVLAGSLLLAGCGASNSGGGTAAPGGSDASNAATADYAKTWGECKPGSSAKNVADIQGEDKDKDITIGAFPF